MTNCSNPSGRVDTSHRQIASCENFCENPCLRSKSHKIKSDWTCATCCGDKFCCGVKDLSWFVAATYRATCCRNLSPDLHTKGNLPPRRVAVTCRLVCSYRYFQLFIKNNLLIPLEKKCFFIFLLLLSLPLQKCKFCTISSEPSIYEANSNVANLTSRETGVNRRREWLWKPANHQTWKQRYGRLFWELPNCAKSFAFCSQIVTEKVNSMFVSLGQ